MSQKISVLIISVILLFGSGISFSGVRCDNDIISVGDTKALVASKIGSCGQVLSKDSYVKEIENSSGENSTKVQKLIDLWSVRIQEKGGNYYCYPLTFEDGILIDIGSWDQCN